MADKENNTAIPIEVHQLEKRLHEIEAERSSILSRLDTLWAALKKDVPLLGTSASEAVPNTPDEKVELFHRLFCCRESVFPRRWENQLKGTKGYSPVCRNEWVRGVCEKPKVKCAVCSNRDFQPLDKDAILKHLQGEHTIGTYAIREDDSCIFLTCDFDGEGWQEDAIAYQDAATEIGVQACIERSRSGKGAHAWIFFAEPVPAGLARILGTIILTKAGEARYTMGLASYDRFFPNQDFIPKGGFGNLIALPLQQIPRQHGNSEFIDKTFVSIKNQWTYLASAKRLSLLDVRGIVNKLLPKLDIQGRRADPDRSFAIDEDIIDSIQDEPIKITSPTTIEIQISSQVSIPIAGFPPSLITKLKRCATFPNPRFYELQRMRMPTYPHPRFIFSGELRENEIVLPRGLIEKAMKILHKAGVTVSVLDKRLKKKRFQLSFQGQLTAVQQNAVSEMICHDIGVLVAPPGAGKTVMGCALIAHHRVPTLILVHRQPLAVQWKEQLHTYLGLGSKEIGSFTGTKKKHSGIVDIAMLQSLARSQDLSDIRMRYGQVIIDECHHIPAASFEAVLKEIPAKFIYGLTATPYRKDRLEKILFQQCGPIRFEMEHPGHDLLEKRVVVRETGFRLSEEVGARPPYHILIESLMKDESRMAMIVSDVVEAIRNGRFPLIIADRKEFLERLEQELCITKADQNMIFDIVRMDGDLSAKERRESLHSIRTNVDGKHAICILATASLIGEGFDLPELDTLIIASPLSFKGRLVQYAGRLHRLIEGKQSVLIHDYLDSFSPMMLKMYKNRLKAYKDMGYEVEFLHKSIANVNEILKRPKFKEHEK